MPTPASARTRPPRLVIAGVSSGVGKTTITAGLSRALRERGLVVQPFKTGPDYIDPSYHTLAAGRPCRNLDPWMLPSAALARSLEMGCRGADFALIEGVMGLFDSSDYATEEGSTAHLAKLLDAPVVLVMNIASMARSAAALAQGYARFDPALRVAGFILNQAGSPGHGDGVARAVTAATGLPCFGCFVRDETLEIPERHLGLVPVAEPGRWEEFISAAAARVAAAVDLDALLTAAGWTSGQTRMAAAEEIAVASGAPRIAVARDEAFSFYYEDNFDLLREAGAELVFFSPLRDRQLPAGTSGLYLGGGFPEVYAAELSANRSLLADLGRAIADGLPTYAECGGLMTLTESTTDLEGHTYPMVGALPGRSHMTGRLTLGYRVATATGDNTLAPPSVEVRGHEFHYSEWSGRSEGLPAAYRFAARGGEPARLEGYARGRLVASYLHLHWLACPAMPERFVAWCRDAAGGSHG